MKYLLFAVMVAAVSCKETQELTSEQTAINTFQKSSEMAVNNRAAYQGFIPGVKFITQVDKPEKMTNVLIKEQKAFIETSGLPDLTTLSEWLQSHTPSDAVKIYTDFANAYSEHEYLPTFLQYQGWLILTKLHLLNSGTNEQIHAVLQKMVSAKYKGYGVINYTLNRLNDGGFDKTKLSGLAHIVLNDAPQVSGSPTPVSLTKVPPFAKKDIEEGVNQFLKKEAEDRQYIEQIKKFVKN